MGNCKLYPKGILDFKLRPVHRENSDNSLKENRRTPPNSHEHHGRTPSTTHIESTRTQISPKVSGSIPPRPSEGNWMAPPDSYVEYPRRLLQEETVFNNEIGNLLMPSSVNENLSSNYAKSTRQGASRMGDIRQSVSTLDCARRNISIRNDMEISKPNHDWTKTVAAPLKLKNSDSTKDFKKCSTSITEVMRGPAFSPYEGRGPAFLPYEGRGPAFSPYEGRGPAFSPYEGRGPTFSPYEGRGPTFSPYEGRGPTFSPYEGRGPTFSPYEGRGQTFSPYEGRESTVSACEERGPTVSAYEGGGQNSITDRARSTSDTQKPARRFVRCCGQRMSTSNDDIESVSTREHIKHRIPVLSKEQLSASGCDHSRPPHITINHSKIPDIAINRQTFYDHETGRRLTYYGIF